MKRDVKFLLVFYDIFFELSFRTMAIEWIANGVRVNAVSPGTIFSQTASDNYAIDVFQMAIPHIPAKRLGKMAKKPRTSAFFP